MRYMSNDYGQFCPIAKASEIFATRWTPLILRELMSGVHSFNDIHRGMPTISRAVLVARLRELQKRSVVERRSRADGTGHEYWLTPAGEGFRAALSALGQWGQTHTYDQIKPSDLDPGLLMWGLRGRVNVSALPERRVVLRFEFAGVPASRTKFRIMWLVFKYSDADVCAKDPGFAVDLTLRGDIRDWVAVFLGRATWPEVTRTAVRLEGDGTIAKMVPKWLGLDAVGRRDHAISHAAARPIHATVGSPERLVESSSCSGSGD
jgi:DNA-binding HxlR family transcriptional regulator